MADGLSFTKDLGQMFGSQNVPQSSGSQKMGRVTTKRKGLLSNYKNDDFDEMNEQASKKARVATCFKLGSKHDMLLPTAHSHAILLLWVNSWKQFWKCPDAHLWQNRWQSRDRLWVGAYFLGPFAIPRFELCSYIGSWHARWLLSRVYASFIIIYKLWNRSRI